MILIYGALEAVAVAVVLGSVIGFGWAAWNKRRGV